MEATVNNHGLKMKFDDLIQYKALHFDYVSSGANAEIFYEGFSAEEKKKHFRNVCALISIPLFDRLENTCGFLDISKRQFIEAALIECLDKAESRVSQCEEMLVSATLARQEKSSVKEVI